MFVSPAFAQAAPAAGGQADLFASLMPLLLIFVVFYFLLIRPQQRRLKQHKEMLTALRRGDRVVTGGGIIGTVIKVLSDTEVMVEIADNVRVRVARETIANVLAKTEPVAGGKDEDKDEGETAPAESKDTPRAQGLGRLLGGKDR